MRLSRLAVLAGVGAGLVAPAVAHAASAPAGPQIVQINAATGQQSTLLSGPSLGSVNGLWLSGSTLYFSNTGASSPSGVFSVPVPVPVASRAPTVTPIVTTAPTAQPAGLLGSADGSTLTSFDASAGIVNVDLATGAQTVLASGGTLITEPVGFVSPSADGSTWYATSTAACSSLAEGGWAFVQAISPITGAQTTVKNLNCAEVNGVAAEPAGTLLLAIADQNTNSSKPSTPSIVRLNPATGAVTTLTSGGKLVAPEGVALVGTTLYVADSLSVIAVNTITGAQSVVSSTGLLGGAQSIAAGNGMVYVGEGGTGPLGSITATSPQTYSPKGVKFSVSCSVACDTQIRSKFTVSGSSSFTIGSPEKSLAANQRGSFTTALSRRQRSAVSSALSRGRRVTMLITFTPSLPDSATSGKPVTRMVRLRR